MSGHHNNGCGCGGNCAGNCSGGCGGIGASALERVRYFSRQVVTAADLTRDQEYFRDSLRRHNRLLHGWGVVCGARVRAVPGTCQLVVEPGYILGPQGDEIVIDREVTIDACQAGLNGESLDPCAAQVDPWCTNVRVDRPDGRPSYLAIRYDQCPTRPVRVPAGGCGGDTTACEYSRIRDSFAVKILHELPASYANLRPAPATPSFLQQPSADHGRDTQQADPPAARRCGSPCPPCPEDPWVILADIFIQDGKVIFVDCFNNRRLVASFADFYHLCPPAKPSLLKLEFNPPSVFAGDQTKGTVTLVAPAPSGGVDVNIAYDDNKVSGPHKVTINAGQRSATFDLNTPTKNPQPLTVTVAVEDGNTVSQSIERVVLAKVQLSNELFRTWSGNNLPSTINFFAELSAPAPYQKPMPLLATNNGANFPGVDTPLTLPKGERHIHFPLRPEFGELEVMGTLNDMIQSDKIQLTNNPN
jgi:hypothetical protein